MDGPRAREKRSSACVWLAGTGLSTDTQTQAVVRDGQAECVCLADVVEPHDTSYVLETRPPVEGRDSLSVEHVLDTATSEQKTEASYGGVELKTASYVPPMTCSVAVRRSLERVEQVTRGTSPMSTSDIDVLPDISGLLLTSGTETDDVRSGSTQIDDVTGHADR